MERWSELFIASAHCVDRLRASDPLLPLPTSTSGTQSLLALLHLPALTSATPGQAGTLLDAAARDVVAHSPTLSWTPPPSVAAAASVSVPLLRSFVADLTSRVGSLQQETAQSCTIAEQVQTPGYTPSVVSGARLPWLTDPTFEMTFAGRVTEECSRATQRANTLAPAITAAVTRCEILYRHFGGSSGSGGGGGGGGIGSNSRIMQLVLQFADAFGAAWERAKNPRGSDGVVAGAAAAPGVARAVNPTSLPPPAFPMQFIRGVQGRQDESDGSDGFESD